jgi:hypothetical protein
MVRRKVLAVAASVGLLLGSPAMSSRNSASAHPLHTSLAELTFDERSGTVNVSLRVFADDFTAASLDFNRKSTSGSPSGRPPLVAYAIAKFALETAAGRSIALVSCGGKRSGDLLWLCFRGRASGGASGTRVMSRILVEKYKDQINVVQASYGARKASLLFTGGSGIKRLP